MCFHFRQFVGPTHIYVHIRTVITKYADQFEFIRKHSGTFSQIFYDALCVTQDRDIGVLEVYMRCTVITTHVIIMWLSCSGQLMLLMTC